MLKATQPVFETQMKAGGPPVHVTTSHKVTCGGVGFPRRGGLVFRLWWRVTVRSVHCRWGQILLLSRASDDAMKRKVTAHSVVSPRFMREGEVLTTVVKYVQEVSFT